MFLTMHHMLHNNTKVQSQDMEVWSLDSYCCMLNKRSYELISQKFSPDRKIQFI
jgi:hypothetical protein